MNLIEQYQEETGEFIPIYKDYNFDKEMFFSDFADFYKSYSKWLEAKLERTKNTEQANQPDSQ